jgi:hypothetical protein
MTPIHVACFSVVYLRSCAVVDTVGLHNSLRADSIELFCGHAGGQALVERSSLLISLYAEAFLVPRLQVNMQRTSMKDVSQ